MLKFFSELGSKKVEEMKLKSNEGKELKPGTKVYAKVLKSNGNKYLLNLNGYSILAKSEKELKEGQLVKLKIEKVTDKNELIVKVADENKKPQAFTPVAKEADELLKIKREILKLSIEEKIYLNNTEVEELVEGLDKFRKRGKSVTEDLIKALIVMKKVDNHDEDVFIGLRKYYAGETDKNINIKTVLKDLKKEIEKLEKNKDILSKGVNTVNKINDKQGFLALLLGIKEFDHPVSIQIKKEGKNREFSKDNLNLTIKLELEKLGKLDVLVNIWKRRLNLNFMFYGEVDKRRFVDLKSLEKNIEKLGYIVEEIHIGRKAEEKIGDIGNINYRV